MKNLELVPELLERSVKEIFKVTLSTDANLLDSTSFAIPKESYFLLSTLGFSGDLVGEFSICLSLDSGCQIVGKMLGMDLEDSSEDVVDGTGELMNMIGGNFRMKAFDVGIGIDIGIPTTLRCRDMHRSEKSNDLIHLSQVYDFDGGSIQVESTYRVGSKKEGGEEKSEEYSVSEDASDLLNRLLGDK